MGKFINPFTDVGFKKIFGQEITKDLLIDFLNGLLVNEKSITDITFLDKELLPEYMADRDTHETFSDKLRFIFIELPFFHKEEAECETDFERWIYVLKNMETLKRMPFKARKSVFEKLEKIVDIASLTKEERMKYDESIKVFRDNLATISFAKQEGREEGWAEGRWDMARNLKKIGISTDIISQASGLSAEEIENL